MSIDTVTLLSEVEIRSTEMPCSRKHVEGVGEEADLVPHLHRFHRDERDAAAMRDGLELRLVVVLARWR